MDRIAQLKQKFTTGIKNLILKNMQFRIEGQVAIISLNVPKSLNALSPELIYEMCQLLNFIKQNIDIKVVIIESLLEKAFSAGANITQFQNKTQIENNLYDPLDLMRQTFQNFNRPIIACVNSLALGGGFELALLCSIIVATKGTKFGLPEIKLGVFPSLGGTVISKTIGKYLSNELILTGKFIDVEKMKDWKIVNHIEENKNKAYEKSIQIAKDICKYSLQTITTLNSVLKTSYSQPVETAMQNEKHQFDFLLESKTAQEGLSAFLEKRKPKFEN